MMTDTRNSALLQKLRDWLEANGEGAQTKLAKKIGMSNSSGINQYLAGTYKSVAKMEERLTNFFKLEEEAGKLKLLSGFRPTSISSQVYEKIKLCHLTGGISIECGDSSIGKTMAAKQYKEDHGAATVLLTANPCYSSVTASMRMLSKALGTPYGTKDAMIDHCKAALTGRRVIIIDEAQHLNMRAIDTFRSFSDDEDLQVGVILIGNRGILSSLLLGRNIIPCDQIRKRLLIPKERYTGDILPDDIQLLFPALKDENRSLELLLKLAHTGWGVRGAVTVYNLAVQNGNISYPGILAAAKANQFI